MSNQQSKRQERTVESYLQTSSETQLKRAYEMLMRNQPHMRKLAAAFQAEFRRRQHLIPSF